MMVWTRLKGMYVECETKKKSTISCRDVSFQLLSQSRFGRQFGRKVCVQREKSNRCLACLAGMAMEIPCLFLLLSIKFRFSSLNMRVYNEDSVNFYQELHTRNSLSGKYIL